MFELVYGPSGSGKSQMLTERIKKDVQNGKKKVYLIVPEQLVLSTERRMLSVLPASAQLNFNVLSFSRLANLVFRKYGGLSYNYVTPGIKTLVTWLAVKEAAPALKEFGYNSAADETLPVIIQAAISEFKAYSVTPDALSAASVAIDSTSSSRKKLEDLALIYAIYEEMINEKFDDASDDLTKLEAILRENDYFSGANVYFDAFIGFTAQEFSIIERILSQADNIMLALCLDKPHTLQPHFATSNDTALKLRRMSADICGSDNIREYRLTEIHRTKSEELLTINEDLWRYELSESDLAPIDMSDSGAVEMYVCSDQYAEAEMIANYIQRAVESGYRYRDIAVIFRSASERIGILDTVLEKNGIPFFMSQKTDVISKPIVKLIMSALRIHIFNYDIHDVMSFFKTGLIGFSAMETDIFEDYCTTWNIRGKRFAHEWTANPDGYKREFSERSENILKTAEQTRKLFMELIGPFCEALAVSKTVSDICGAVYKLLERLQVTDRLTALSQKEASLGFVKEADETLQLYNIIIRSLSDIASLIGDKEITVSEFLTVFKLVMSDTEIGTIPTSSDAVTVGSADLLRLHDIKCVFVGGLCEGEFPANVSESPILSDSDKALLAENGIELSANKSTEISDELFYAYNALTVASEKLILSAPETNSGSAPNHLSSVFERVRFLLPNVKVYNYGKLPADKKYYSARSALESLTHQYGHMYRSSIEKALGDIDGYSEMISLLGKKITDDEITLSKDTTDMIFGKKLRLSQSKIEKYISCKLSYYCDHVLKLRSHRTVGFKMNDMGLFIHYVLEHSMRYLLDKDGFCGINDLDDDEIDGIVEITVNKFVAENYPDEIKSSGRMMHLIEKMQRLAKLLIHGLVSEFRDSDFIPAFFELKIGDKDFGAAPLEIPLENGKKVLLNGVVDRVDLYSSDGKIYIRVVDYKTGAKTFAFSDIEKGRNLQTLLYLFALCKSSDLSWLGRFGTENVSEDDEFCLLPAGAVYMSSKIGTLHPENILEESEVLRLASESLIRKGVSTSKSDILRAISHTLSKNIIPGGAKSGNKYLLSDDDFKALYNDIEQVIKGISMDMLTGDCSARAYVSGNTEYPDEENTCAYCDMRSICRITSKN